MFAYISMEVWIGFQLDLWNVDLLTATFIWAVASGGVLLFKSATLWLAGQGKSVNFLTCTILRIVA